MNSICVVIVTWNRLALLKACVDSVKKNAPQADILVVDNASSDGTGEWLSKEPGVNVLSLSENTGGAGGFAKGMQWAFERGYEWMWIMDDDVVALPNALNIIAENSLRADVIQCAKYESNGDECVFEGLLNPRTMLRRKIRVADVPLCGYMPCNVATFEGLFVHRKVIELIGLPDASFFYGLDDLFYGYLVSEKLRFIFVPQFVLKKQINKSRALVKGFRFYSSTPSSRFYHVRNYWKVMRYLKKTGSGSWRMYFTYSYEVAKALALTLLMEQDWKGFMLVLRGVVDGIRGKGGKA